MAKSRRKFLTEVFLKPEDKEGTMVRAMTKDGKIILIDPRYIDSMEKTKRASNRELLDWIYSNS